MLVKLNQIEHGEKLAETINELQNKVINNYYDKTQIDQKITDAAAGGKVDLSGYAKKEDIVKTEFATEEEINSLVPTSNKNVLILNPTTDNTPYFSHYNDKAWDIVKSTGRLPWDEIDFSYITKAQFTFNTSNVGNLTEAPVITNLENIRSCRYLYYYQEKLESVSPLDSLINCDDFYQAFAGCQNLKSVSDFKVAYKADCSWAFYYCKSLTKAPNISGKIGKANCMFEDCPNLTDVPEYDLSACKDMYCMFYGCSGLKGEFPWEIDLSSVKTTGDLSSMFYNTGITKVTLKNVPQSLNPDNPDNVLNGSTLSNVLGGNSLEVIVKNYKD